MDVVLSMTFNNNIRVVVVLATGRRRQLGLNNAALSIRFREQQLQVGPGQPAGPVRLLSFEIGRYMSLKRLWDLPTIQVDDDDGDGKAATTAKPAGSIFQTCKTEISPS